MAVAIRTVASQFNPFELLVGVVDILSGGNMVASWVARFRFDTLHAAS